MYCCLYTPKRNQTKPNHKKIDKIFEQVDACNEEDMMLSFSNILWLSF